MQIASKPHKIVSKPHKIVSKPHKIIYGKLRNAFVVSLWFRCELCDLQTIVCGLETIVCGLDVICISQMMIQQLMNVCTQTNKNDM